MRRRWDDIHIELVIGNLLRAGVLAAAAVVMGGGVAYLVAAGGGTPHYSAFKGEPTGLNSIPAIAAGAFAGDPRSVIQLGLLLLIATPVARVAFSAVAFYLEKDRLYAAITVLVLAILVFSLAGGYTA